VSEAWSAQRLGDADAPLFCVFVHGGFWRQRYTAAEIQLLAAACASGEPRASVWNIEYPRVGMAGGGWPGTARAVADALAAAIRESAGRPVAIVGHSAGGHLALWAAGEHPVALAVSLAGVCNLRAAVEARLGDGAAVAFFGGEPDDRTLAAADPIARLPLRSPSLLIHGDADDTVPVSQSTAYHAAAVAAGDSCELHLLRGAGHFEVVDPRGRAWPIVRARLRALSAG